jgi:putative MATE family efflux protein
VLRGMLDTVTPLRVAVGGALANVVLNWVLIYPVGLGLAGAAAGTAIAQTAMAWVLVRRVLREASQCDVTWRPDLGGVLSSGRAGVPLLVRTAAMRVTLLVATAVAADMGTSALAAHQVAFVVWTLLAMILDALAIAAQAMVGTSLGAGDVDATRRLGRRLIGWGVLSGATLGAALLLLRYPVALLVTTDPGVRDLIVASLAVAALLQPMAGLVFALDGVLIGAGDNLYLAGAAALATGVFVPLALATQMLTTGADGLVWLWWAIGGWMLVRAVTLSVRVYGERWLVPGAAASSDPRK